MSIHAAQTRPVGNATLAPKDVHPYLLRLREIPKPFVGRFSGYGDSPALWR